MQAAAQGEDYAISFGGTMQFHLASDMAQQFIAAATTPVDGAHGYNPGTPPVRVQDVADIIMQIVPGRSDHSRRGTAAVPTWLRRQCPGCGQRHGVPHAPARRH